MIKAIQAGLVRSQTPTIASIYLGLICALVLNLLNEVTAAQGPKIPRIGFLPGGGNANVARPNFQAFREGLRDLQYVEGKNILIEDRYIAKSVNEFPVIINELLEHKIDVLVVQSLVAIAAAKKATRTIPIVIVTTVDPVENGFVESLAHPGGNITGVATLTRQLSGKRLELLKELAPRTSRVAVLNDSDAPISALTLKEYEPAARALKLELQSLGVRSPNPEFEKGFQAAVKEGANALVTIANPMLGLYREQIANFAIKNRLPSVSDGNGYVEAGFLMSYLANTPDLFRRAATYVDKILKGAKPADLPVEQARKFEFLINLKTAKEIGLTIPQSVLYRADKVIR